MIEFADKLENRLKQKLPGAKSHRKMLPPNRVLQAPKAITKTVKPSSVLLLLFFENKKLSVCLIKRPAHMKHHARQIALPGGRGEKGESAIETALRETYEEIGVRPEEIRILGKLSPFYVEVSHFVIQPVVGWLSQKPRFKTNSDEVEKMIIFPLEKFKPPFCKVKMNTLTGEAEVPCIKYNDEIIWGATAMILAEITDVLGEINLTSE